MLHSLKSEDFDRETILSSDESIHYIPEAIKKMFQEFWNIYPNKEHFKRSLLIFYKDKYYESLETIKKDLKYRKNKMGWKEGNPFIPLPYRYLLDNRWLDNKNIINEKNDKPPIYCYYKDSAHQSDVAKAQCKEIITQEEADLCASSNINPCCIFHYQCIKAKRNPGGVEEQWVKTVLKAANTTSDLPIKLSSVLKKIQYTT